MPVPSPTSTLPLSVAVITFNEQDNLPRCLQSVAGLAAEIVVIDSGSQDCTLDIAREFGAVIEQRPWPGHVQQKNYALQRCRQPWVLSLDADEALSDELRAAIQSLFAAGEPPAEGYWVNRRNFYLGEWIWHAWYPEWRLRLVRRERGRWQGINPHDSLVVSGATQRLSGDLLHYSYRDLNDHLLRTISYARIGAQARLQQGERFRWYKLLLSPWGRFLRSMLVKQAWRDGWRGWLIAFSSMLAAYAKYAFLLEAHLREKQAQRQHTPR
jgi:glycosyltransferase involved in cell wall biosynthesis